MAGQKGEDRTGQDRGQNGEDWTGGRMAHAQIVEKENRAIVKRAIIPTPFRGGSTDARFLPAMVGLEGAPKAERSGGLRVGLLGADIPNSAAAAMCFVAATGGLPEEAACAAAGGAAAVHNT